MVQQHRFFERNKTGRDFVVGDVHGEYGRLTEALRLVGFEPAVDRLFGVGDLVDRGPDSEAMVELLAEPWFFSVVGNHELMLIDSEADPGAKVMHATNGGQWFHDLSPMRQGVIRGQLTQECALAFSIDTDWGTLGIVHATAPSDWHTIQEVPLEPGHWEELVWDRSDYRMALTRPELMTPVRNVSAVVHGHVSCTYVVRVQNRFWIDTLYRGGDLTLLTVDKLFDRPQQA